MKEVKEERIMSDTYLVFDMPKEVSDKIYDIRRKFSDVFRVQLPVEVTVAGSSGVGVLKKGQHLQDVIETLKPILQETQPFYIEFDKVFRFEGTDIYVLSIKESILLEEIHTKIIESSILFESSPFPYMPHCTLIGVEIKTPSELLEYRLEGKFLVESFSLYTMDGLPMKRPFHYKLK